MDSWFASFVFFVFICCLMKETVFLVWTALVEGCVL